MLKSNTATITYAPDDEFGSKMCFREQDKETFPVDPFGSGQTDIDETVASKLRSAFKLLFFDQHSDLCSAVTKAVSSCIQQGTYSCVFQNHGIADETAVEEFTDVLMATIKKSQTPKSLQWHDFGRPQVAWLQPKLHRHPDFPETVSVSTPVSFVKDFNTEGAFRYFVSSASCSSWLSQQLEKVRNFKKLTHNWNSYGADPPNDWSSYWTYLALIVLEQMGLRGTVNPSGEGGLAIVFRRGDTYADIEFLNDQSLLAVIRHGTSPSEAWELKPNMKALRETIRKIGSAIEG